MEIDNINLDAAVEELPKRERALFKQISYKLQCLLVSDFLRIYKDLMERWDYEMNNHAGDLDMVTLPVKLQADLVTDNGTQITHKEKIEWEVKRKEKRETGAITFDPLQRDLFNSEED